MCIRGVHLFDSNTVAPWLPWTEALDHTPTVNVDTSPHPSPSKRPQSVRAPTAGVLPERRAVLKMSPLAPTTQTPANDVRSMNGSQPGAPLKSVRTFLPFEEAMRYVGAMGFQNSNEWFAWCRSGGRPNNIPAAPWQTYQSHGWRNIQHWLGCMDEPASTHSKATSNQAKDPFLPFDKAWRYVQLLELHSTGDWWRWSSSGARPNNIPSTPQRFYLNAGWRGWDYWLGKTAQPDRHAMLANPAAPRALPKSRHGFWSFKTALQYVRKLSLKNEREWRAWRASGSRPNGIPADPGGAYRETGWQGWHHWLGIQSYPAESQSKTKVHGTPTTPKTPITLPKKRRPWAGEENKSLRRGVEKHGVGKWALMLSDPDLIFTDRSSVDLKDRWRNLSDQKVKSPPIRTFKQALSYARALKLTSWGEWKVWSSSGARPNDIPSNPNRAYARDGWQGMIHWLGCSTAKFTKNDCHGSNNPEIPKMAPSNDPRQYCGFCCQKETPSNLLTCAKCSNSGHQKCLQFNDQLWDRCQGDSTWECIECKSCSVCRIQGEDEKLLFCDMCDCATHMHCLTPSLTVIPQGNWQCPPCSVPKPHTRLPKCSARQAGGENETVADSDEDGWLPFGEARQHVVSLNLKSPKAWEMWCKSGQRPANIPSNPQRAYKHDGWQGCDHWLGTGNPAGADRGGTFLSFVTALQYSRSLKLTSTDEWYAWNSRGSRPANIPCRPDQVYRDDGWQCWGHWLNTSTQRLRDGVGEYATKANGRTSQPVC